jgi:hypothetical protein
MATKRQLLCYLFLTLYVVAILRPFTPYVNYYLNKEKITEEKCVNKDKPAMECDGKCYLKKQVISSQQERDESPISLNFDVEKYVHNIEVSNADRNFISGDEAKKLTILNNCNVLEGVFSVPDPPPKKWS